MNCFYCSQECEQADTKSFRIRNCHPCHVRYYFLANSEAFLYVYWDNIQLNDINFTIKIYNGVTGNAPETVVMQDMSPKAAWVDILRLDFVPEDWTPQNIKEKLQKYLPLL